jgi:hypothetical protein
LGVSEVQSLDSIRLLTGSSSSDYSSSDGCISLTAGSASTAPGPIAECRWSIVGGFRWKLVATFHFVQVTVCLELEAPSQLLREQVSKPDLETSYWD